MPEAGERHFAQELRSVNLAGSQVESAWKQQQKKAALSFGHVSTKTIREQRAGLPIAQLRNELMDAIRDHQCLVVIGETGSGKTTQMTQYMAEMGLTSRGAVSASLHAIDATRVHRTMAWVVSFSILSRLGPRRCSAQA